jgi:hypothetical protein
MHEHFELYGSNNNEVYKRNADSQFAVQQYLKAIVHLLDPMKRKESQAADVALTTCVIFICIEVSRRLILTPISLTEKKMYTNTHLYCRLFAVITVRQYLILTEV